MTSERSRWPSWLGLLLNTQPTTMERSVWKDKCTCTRIFSVCTCIVYVCVWLLISYSKVWCPPSSIWPRTLLAAITSTFSSHEDSLELACMGARMPPAPGIFCGTRYSPRYKNSVLVSCKSVGHYCSIYMYMYIYWDLQIYLLRTFTNTYYNM